jgi:hypothetical protein
MVIGHENDESEQGVSGEWFRVVRIRYPGPDDEHQTS